MAMRYLTGTCTIPQRGCGVVPPNVSKVCVKWFGGSFPASRPGGDTLGVHLRAVTLGQLGISHRDGRYAARVSLDV